MTTSTQRAPVLRRRLLKGLPAPRHRDITQGDFALADGVRQRLTLLALESRPQVGAPIAIQWRCSNIGTSASPPAQLGLIWTTAGATPLVELARQVVLEVPAQAPGTETLQATTVLAPINSALDVNVSVVLQSPDGMPWQQEGATIEVRRHLCGGIGGAEFDYQDAYAQVDLECDWWSIVGPATLEEYIELGKGKLAQLRRLGLRADVRFLDIGCGTGQLTQQLVDVISPSGAYVGTDIAQHAVDFCRRRFPQQNFRFFKNETTRLPLKNEEFDIVYLASVFTHMELLEIVGMLAEIARILAQGGWVLADAFVSPAVDQQHGNHSMMILNEAALQTAFDAQGFTWQEINATSWNDQCRRVVYKLWR